MKYSPCLDALITSLKCLPGIGPKSAERMAFHLLERRRDGAKTLSTAIEAALSKIGHCERCRMLTEASPCHFCTDPKRDNTLLCVVQTPADLMVIEQSGGFRGRYFVLGGQLSPLEGIGPEALGLEKLAELLKDPGVKEVILATNATVEGEATAYYIAEQVKALGRQVSRIAQGVPRGGELVFVDAPTLSRALLSRTAV